MIVNREQQWVYVSTPKSGTHTMFRLLVEEYGGEQLDGPYHRRDVPSWAHGWFVFSCVRDPFDRAASAWHHLLGVERYAPIWRPVMGGKQWRHFYEYLARMTDCPTYRGDVVLHPQATWLADVALDAVVHLECLADDLAGLPFGRVGTDIPRLLRREYEWPAWTDRATAVINEWAAPDCEQFGYPHQTKHELNGRGGRF